MLELSSVVAAATVIAAVLVTALLVMRIAAHKRRHNRRLFMLLTLFLLAWGVAQLLQPLAPAWLPLAHAVADLLGFFTLVAVGGVLLFDVGLAAIGVRVPTIAAELAMGVCYLVAALAVMQRFGFHPTSILAASTVLASIIALSLQATLGNVIGGVALQLDDSIHVGDWVQLENGRQGLVREIRWRHTVIETRDWDTLIVPNAQLLASSFLILGKRAGEPVQHRMWVYFNVDFRYSPSEVIRVVEQALHTAVIEGVAADPPPNCICYDLAREHKDAMAYYAVRYWLTDLARDDPASSRVRARVFTALKRAEIPLAIPAANLWIDQDGPERRARKHEKELARRRAALKTVGFFAPLTPSEVDQVADALHYAPFSAGETITREGAVAHWLYVITAGKADVTIAGAGKKRQKVATIEGPDVVGEMGLMTGAPRSASVIAKTEVECYRLEKDAFHGVLAQRPELAVQISELMAARHVELQSRQATRTDPGVVADEKVRLLGAVRRFFGLDDQQ